MPQAASHPNHQPKAHTHNQVHGRLYKSLFGEEPPVDRLVGHGFSIRNGVYNFKSGVFNTSGIDPLEEARHSHVLKLLKLL